MEGSMQSTAEAVFPMGTTVTTTVYAIGGRSETVSGEVVGYRRSSVVVQTDCHGRIVVPLSKVGS
jgi:hypothetical protein